MPLKSTEKMNHLYIFKFVALFMNIFENFQLTVNLIQLLSFDNHILIDKSPDHYIKQNNQEFQLIPIFTSEIAYSRKNILLNQFGPCSITTRQTIQRRAHSGYGFIPSFRIRKNGGQSSQKVSRHTHTHKHPKRDGSLPEKGLPIAAKRARSIRLIKHGLKRRREATELIIRRGAFPNLDSGAPN